MLKKMKADCFIRDAEITVVNVKDIDGILLFLILAFVMHTDGYSADFKVNKTFEELLLSERACSVRGDDWTIMKVKVEHLGEQRLLSEGSDGFGDGYILPR